MSRLAATPALAVASLRRVAAALAAGELLAPDDAGWLLAGLERYLAEAPEGVSLEKCLGLAAPQGGRSWWREERLARRDTALRIVGAEFFADLDVSPRAEELARALRGHRMPRDDSEAARRAAAVRPAVRKRFVELADVHPIPGPRQIERILATAFRHELPDPMSETACHADPNEQLS
jgi:hypothetical protein